MIGHVEVSDPAQSDLQGHKHIENLKASRHDDKEITSQDHSGVISDERHPWLRGSAFLWPSAHGRVFALSRLPKHWRAALTATRMLQII
jgi:hypothetical protein